MAKLLLYRGRIARFMGPMSIPLVAARFDPSPAGNRWSMDATVSALLQPTSLAPGLARNWVEGLPVEGSVTRDLRLLTHEVVSNSVQHAGMGPKDPVRLNIFLSPEHVRIEVWDRGPGFDPEPRPPCGSNDRGMGLFVLDRLADRWGVQSGECTCVWFELDLPQTNATTKEHEELVSS